MKQDINTILANLAVTIAEKEEDIKRLTERVKEQETVVLRGEDEKDLPKKFVDLTIEYEQLRSEYIEKDAMLSQVSHENNQRRLHIIDLEAEISALKEKLDESIKENLELLSESERILLRQANTYLTDIDTIDWHRNFRVEEINTEDNHYTIFAFADNFDPQQKSYFQLRLKED